jgi:hypothetical protein
MEQAGTVDAMKISPTQVWKMIIRTLRQPACTVPSGKKKTNFLYYDIRVENERLVTEPGKAPGNVVWLEYRETQILARCQTIYPTENLDLECT